MRLAPLALMVLATLPAHAGPLVFASRAAFTRAAGATVAETFGRCARATMVFTGPLDTRANAACGAGAIRAGLSIAGSGGPGDNALYLAAPFYGANREMAVGQDGPASDALRLDFAGTRAAGFDLFQNFGGGAQLGRAAAFDVQVFSGALQIGDYTVSVASGRRAFFGVISGGAAITAITVNNRQAYDMVGDIVFARGADNLFAARTLAAPEPAAIALLGLAALGLGTLRRR